jgi:3-oxoacyl-[acyl-carrier protein] reductase
MDLSLSGKIALVGGASQGIGYAIAHLLASEGASVAMVARKEEPLNEACARIAAETGAKTFAIPADIRKGADCERIISQAFGEFERIDILINNDGAPPLGELESFDDLAWQKAIEQNLMSVVRLCRGALPSMKQQGWGRIVNITALSAIQPIARFGLSVATWAGVLGYAKTLSLEIAAQGVTINTICPGRIATGRLATVFGNGTPGQLEQEQLAQITKLIPMGRVGEPNEIAGLVAFLCSPWGAYMTGTVQHVDGGRLGSLI